MTPEKIIEYLNVEIKEAHDKGFSTSIECLGQDHYYVNIHWEDVTLTYYMEPQGSYELILRSKYRDKMEKMLRKIAHKGLTI